jgi:hypothetical protein
MRASDVISTLKARGVTLQADGDNLRIKGASRLTAEEKAALKAHKAAVLKALEPDSATAPYQLCIDDRAQLVWLVPNLEPAKVLRRARARYPDLDVTDSPPAHGWPRLHNLPELSATKHRIEPKRQTTA